MALCQWTGLFTLWAKGKALWEIQSIQTSFDHFIIYSQVLAMGKGRNPPTPNAGPQRCRLGGRGLEGAWLASRAVLLSRGCAEDPVGHPKGLL